MLEIVVLDSYAAVSTDLSLDMLNKFCGKLTVYDRTKPHETVSRIGQAEIIIVNKTVLSKEVLEQCPSVKYIGLFATGYNIIDIEYCKANGIVVANVPGYSTNGVAQLTFAFMMNFYNMVDSHNQRVHDGSWENCIDFCFYDRHIAELSGKTLGIVGFGSIGKKVAQIAAAFDMNILVHTRTSYSDYDKVRFVPLDELLEESDIVSLHCPLFDETAEMIDKRALSLMKPNSILINTARGGLINEQALADALNSEHLRGAAVDVVSVEPVRSDNPLLTAKNCIITPHIAWAGKETRARLIGVVANNIEAYLGGEPTNNVCNTHK